MKRLIPLIFLAACGAQPTPMMMGAERIEVTRNGRQYVVFKKEKTVEISAWATPRAGSMTASGKT